MMAKRQSLTLIGLFCSASLTAASFAWPTGAYGDGKQRLNQDQVREAVKSGQMRPLVDVLAVAQNVIAGTVVGVEVERRRGKIVYEIKIIADRGRVREVYIDAATLDVVEVE
jgi:uncharacterized membrane protein YkoI